MLPLELLRVRTRKGQIKPFYAEITTENLKLADDLVKLFQEFVGKRKGSLMDKVSTYEMAGFDYRLVRGLSLILQRNCIFQVEAAVNPNVARRMIFEEANRRGHVDTDQKRNEVLQGVARQLKVSCEELEKSFQADLESELILKDFTIMPSSELLKNYNLSLTQTLLFRSIFMEIKISKHWKEVLREIKFHGLMYSAETNGQVLKIMVDGPFSLFKLTQRYGTSMAKLLPSILQTDKWEINASILRASQFSKRIYQLNLKSSEVREKIKSSKIRRKSNAVGFDSIVEERFFYDFKGLNTGWKLIREPAPIIVDKHVFIPDFCFEKSRIKVYFEIVGFWTKNYLERKIQKLQQLKETEILIAANENLACDKLKQLKGEIIFYKRTVPLKPILRFLESKEERIVQFEIDNLRMSQLNLKGDVVYLRKLAEVYGISDKALRRKLEDYQVDNYTLVGDLLISNRKLKEIDKKIVSLSNPSLLEAIRIIEDEGIEKPYDVLSTLNYTICWKGLDPNNSSIRKNQK